ncbi:MAG: hypothetical protein EAY75_09740 [Bacteroidetes bacterium]|nr:MAG: hypothetical protein EAY75_09740 [Bacteroidota bacterium]
MKNTSIAALLVLLAATSHGQNVGIGTPSPSHVLHVVAAANPLRLEGLQSGADTDSMVTVSATGVLRRRTLATATSGGWGLSGNSGINATTNFIGTVNSAALVFRTNNLASGFIDPDNTKRNNAFGHGSMANATIAGNGNNAMGYQALRQLNAGVGNVALGDSVLYTNTAGSNNVGIGPNALEANLASENIAIGANTLVRNFNGSNNIAIGVGTLASAVIALNNLAIGGEALRLAVNSDNVALGYRVGFALTTGSQNTAVGNFAMASNLSGSNNTYLGYQAAQLHTSGNNNTHLGFLAGGNFLSGSNNTMVGGGADALNVNANFSNSTALGAGAIIDRSNMVRLGNSSVTRLEAAVSLTTPSDGRIKTDVRENVPGLDFITLLRPVTYHYDLNKWDAIAGYKKANTSQYAQKEQVTYTGFIAQEVYDAAQKLQYNFSGVSAPITPDGLYGLAYAEMVVPLVKAVQELKALAQKQQQEIDQLKAQIKNNRTQ